MFRILRSTVTVLLPLMYSYRSEFFFDWFWFVIPSEKILGSVLPSVTHKFNLNCWIWYSFDFILFYILNFEFLILYFWFYILNLFFIYLFLILYFNFTFLIMYFQFYTFDFIFLILYFQFCIFNFIFFILYFWFCIQVCIFNFNFLILYFFTFYFIFYIYLII